MSGWKVVGNTVVLCSRGYDSSDVETSGSVTTLLENNF
jgi:hypothetical protein